MASISSYLKAIEVASRGEEVRDAIINALRAINEEGTGNADTLDNHDSTFFATAEQLGGLIPTSRKVEIYPTSWSSDGYYSFENDFPSLKYNIYIQPGPDTTLDQLDAIADATIIVGSDTENVIKCLGTIPDINIQVLVMAVKKL